MDAQERSLLAGEFALGLLGEEERRHVARELDRDPEMRADLGFWQERFAAMADAAEVAPRRAVFADIESRLFGAPEPRGLRESLFAPDNRGWLFAVLAAKGAALAFLIWLLF